MLRLSSFGTFDDQTAFSEEKKTQKKKKLAPAAPLRAVFQMWRRLHHVTQGAPQQGRAADDHSHLPLAASRAGSESPAGALPAACPTCDDVLDGAVLPLVHRSVVFGLPFAQLCDQLLLLLPLLLGLDLHTHRGGGFGDGFFCSTFISRSQFDGANSTLGSCCFASSASNFSLLACSCFFLSSFSSNASC